MCMNVIRKHTSRANLQQGALFDTKGDEMLQLGFLAFWMCIHEEIFCCFSRPNTSILPGVMSVSKDAHKLARQTAEIYIG